MPSYGHTTTAFDPVVEQSLVIQEPLNFDADFVRIDGGSMGNRAVYASMTTSRELPMHLRIETRRRPNVFAKLSGPFVIEPELQSAHRQGIDVIVELRETVMVEENSEMKHAPKRAAITLEYPDSDEFSSEVVIRDLKLLVSAFAAQATPAIWYSGVDRILRHAASK